MGSMIMLVIGFVLLVVGADKFVEGASIFAKKLGIPSLIIGLTIVAFGTSAPELAVSFTAGLNGANEIAIGNVLGSNIFNLLVVIGSSAIVAPLVIEKELLYRDWIASIVGSLLLGVLLLFGKELSRVDAGILLIGFSIVMGSQIYAARNSQAHSRAQEEQQVQVEPKMSMVLVGIYIVVGIASIIVGGKLAVMGATEIARMLQLSESIIGLTVVAIGTSLPELVTSIVATRRGENNIAIGNVIGSNIFNIFFILGLSAVCTPIAIETTAIYDTVLLIIVSGILYIIAKKDWFGGKSCRWIGGGMIAAYIMYTAWIILR